MQTPGENPEYKFGDVPGKDNKFLSFVRNVLLLLLLAALIIGSFWMSFMLGKRILSPAKQMQEQKIEVAIPEPPPSIAGLQKISEVTLEAEKTQVCPTTTTVRGKHYYKVQAGFFVNKENAQNLASKINTAGFETYVKKVGRGWRVQVGAFNCRPQAQKVRKSLKANGIDAIVIYE